MSKPLLTLCKVSAGYNGKDVISNISFSLNKGERLQISGKNGSGKSTLLKTIARIINDNTGDIWYNGKSINQKRTDQLQEVGISYFMQGGLVIPSLTVEEHLNIALKKKSVEDKKVLFKQATELFPVLHDKLKERAGNLSGGQRLALSCAILICQDTELWLLDEPLAGLDKDRKNTMVNFINHSRSKTIVLVEHSNKYINISNSLKIEIHEE